MSVSVGVEGIEATLDSAFVSRGSMRIDFNCDLGEGALHDAELLALITSANVACGFHAGDAGTAHATIRMAAELGVHVGAHPGFADREHFGRRELDLPESRIFSEVVYQVGALQGLARAVGVSLRHLKPHGALYNMACRDEAFARPVVAAAEVFDLPVIGLPGSKLQTLAVARCPFIPEGFADRRYTPEGTLVPRSRPDAMIHDADEAVNQALTLIDKQKIQTLCVHGDTPEALAFVHALRAALAERSIEVRPCP